jgi:hypothetical protein
MGRITTWPQKKAFKRYNNFTTWVGSPPGGKKMHLKDKKSYIMGRITTWRQKKAFKR